MEILYFMIDLHFPSVIFFLVSSSPRLPGDKPQGTDTDTHRVDDTGPSDMVCTAAFLPKLVLGPLRCGHQHGSSKQLPLR